MYKRQPYAAPGDPAQAGALAALDFEFRAALLQNHGPITAGTSLAAAVDAAVEIEEVAALLLGLGQHRPRLLAPAEIGELTAKYGTPWDAAA